jgi:hypothetical protein
VNRKEKREIISFIIELMREEMPYSHIKEQIISRYGLTMEEAESYVKSAFETVSFLAKNTELNPDEKRRVLIGGFIATTIFSALYAFFIIYSQHNLVLMLIFYAFLISKIVYLLGRRKVGIYLQMVSAIYTMLCYFSGEFAIYVYGLRKELLMRGVEIDSNLTIILKGMKPFIIEYLASKSISEYILVICAVLLSISYFTGTRLKRIRE